VKQLTRYLTVSALLMTPMCVSLPKENIRIQTKVHKIPPVYHILPEYIECNPNGAFPQLVFIPHFKEAAQMVQFCDSYNQNEVAWAMVVFYVKWVEEFGDTEGKIQQALNTLLIEWDYKERTVGLAYTSKGKLIENVKVTGLAINPSMIWVQTGATGKISDTSFVHELVHIALWADNGGPDSDHEGSVYPGWKPKHTQFIQDLNKALKKFNI